MAAEHRHPAASTHAPPAPAAGCTDLRALPAFAPVALQLLKLASDEDAGLAQMAGLIRTDPAITTEVLRLANSPLFGSRTPITSIVSALGMLGLTRIRSMVMVIAVRDF